MSIKENLVNLDFNFNPLINVTLEELTSDSNLNQKGRIALLNGKLVFFNGNEIVYPESANYSYTSVNSVQGLPIEYDYIIATLTSGQSISFTSIPNICKTITIIVLNNGNSSITISIPSTLNGTVAYINGKKVDSTLVIKSQESAEISIVRIGDNYFIRTSS